MFSLLILLLGCPSTDREWSVDTSLAASDCTATWGDSCGCEPQCLTAEQIAALDDHCDLDCDVDGGITWTCDVSDGACVVVPAR